MTFRCRNHPQRRARNRAATLICLLAQVVPPLWIGVSPTGIIATVVAVAGESVNTSANKVT